MKLCDCPIGTWLRLDDCPLDAGLALRLQEMGLRAGRAVCVVQRAGFGGRVLLSGQQRLAVDGATAAVLRGQVVAA